MTSWPRLVLGARCGRLTLYLVQFLNVADRAARRARDACSPRGSDRALRACAVFLLAAAVITLRTTNSRCGPARPGGTRLASGQVPAPELAG